MSCIFKDSFNPDIVGRIYKYLKKVLSPYRLNHCISTALFADYLCDRYEIFRKSSKCFIAGLAHDIAREYDSNYYFKVLEKAGLNISSWERTHPVLLHGRVGALILKRELQIEDEEILEAVECHVTGCVGMGVISKIVFVSDYLEPLRGFIDNRDRENFLRRDLNDLTKWVLEETFRYLRREGRPIAPPAESLYEELNGVRL